MAMSENMMRNSVTEEELGNNSGSHHFNNLLPLDLNSLVSDIIDVCEANSSKRHELERLLNRYLKQAGNFASSEPMGLPCRNLENQIRMTGTRTLQLQLMKNIYQPVYTGVPIKGEDGQSLMVALIDNQSGKVVTCGPEASARVEIVALEADFGGCLGESTTREEFKSKIVMKEENKGTSKKKKEENKGTSKKKKEENKGLLSGNVTIDLKEGIGYVGAFQFPHTKFWKGKCPYKLGVLATDDVIGTKVKEGFTDSFVIKDRRLDSNKKSYPPSLSDKVYRLEGIAKDGAFHQRLKEANINTVQQLLKHINTDRQKLRDILGKVMPNKTWEALVAHARTCKGFYLYSSSGCQQNSRVLFDVVGQVIGLFSGFQYFDFEMLPEFEKDHAKNLVVSAFQQWEKVISFNDEASLQKYLGPSTIVYHLKPSIPESSSGFDIIIPPVDIPQSAVSFDDKASLFDESPGQGSIVYPPKSPTMESSGGSKNLFSPNVNELDFPQPTVLSTLFDGSLSVNDIIFPQESHIEVCSGEAQDIISKENDELDFLLPGFSFEDDSTLFNESLSPSNVHFSQQSLIMENFSGGRILNRDIDKLDSPNPVVLSQKIIPIQDSLWDMSYFNDGELQSFDSTGHQLEMHLSYSSQMTDYSDWEMVPNIQPPCEENHDFPLQFSVDVESADNPRTENGPLLARFTVPLMNNARKRYLRNKAKRKWRVLLIVMKMLFVRRNVAGNLPVEKSKLKPSSSFQDLPALSIVDSGSKQPLPSGGDFVRPTLYEPKGFQIFDSHAPVLSRNLSIKSEANLHNAVNDMLLARSIAVAKNITQRKYMSKREKARRRWRKLYSVMRWFSVQRNVTKRATSTLTKRYPSSSFSHDNLSAKWAVNNMSCDGCTGSLDMSPNNQNSSSLDFLNHDDEFTQLFNTFCSLQPRNRIAMKKLARRRNAGDRSFAKKKWRMLFCVMKWLSVRKSARVKNPHNIFS